ncbi:MAG TPA: nucleoside-diphosphate sugar epimerase/dehydratase [Alphaproteobacteria bacterium]
MLQRSTLILAHDGAMAALSYWLALQLRLGGGAYAYSPDLVRIGTPLFTLCALAVFIALGLYKAVWRYASIGELLKIARAAALAVLLFALCLFFITRLETMPRSTLIIAGILLIALMGGARLAYRMYKDRGLEGLFRTDQVGTRNAIPVMLVGAGDGAELFIRSMIGNVKAPYRVVGLIDDKGSRIGRQIHGINIMGGLDELQDAIQHLARSGDAPQRLIITEDSLRGRRLRGLVEQADGLGLTVARLPKLTDFRMQDGAPASVEVRPIAIEDLLGRPQTVLDRSRMASLIAGKRVLVTGAGGSIGGELARQIASYGPARLALLDHSEYALYSIDLEIGERAPDLPRATLLADVRDKERIRAIIAEENPDLVFHAAALKHVPMVELHPTEGVLTNVVGTRNVAEACAAAKVSAMVLISTDKAVNPSSVMGTTKRLAECTLQTIGAANPQTSYVVVRFGNVLGSTGSVVPLFQRQLAAGGPLTVTHPDVTRYFMTVREAVELVLEASILGTETTDGARNEHIYVLDMGEPVKIADLARQMIRLAGLRPDQDVKVAFTGLRPGEKLYEELFHDAEALAPTRYTGVQIAHPRRVDGPTLIDGVTELEAAARRRDRAAVIALIGRLVPEYAAPNHDTGSAK